ncbi:MAG: hypothetical protein EXQ92_14075 [Alphaproteobacteria bacterium]|nr:hypothetical protein [Alphaproteobacteria bacterium]
MRCGTAAAALLLAACAGNGEDDRHRLSALYYAAGVATYCSGLTELAVDGLGHAVRWVRATSSLNPESLAAARDAGYVAADYEWSNRGLGSFRRWCLGEGRASTAWLEGLVTAPTTPPTGYNQAADKLINFYSHYTFYCIMIEKTAI